MIEIENLVKTFKVNQKDPGFRGAVKSLFNRKYIEKKALAGVSLHVNAGETIGLIGANGAGKTTLIKTCTGIIKPTSGQVRVLGVDPFSRRNAFRRQISLIMGQKQQLWWDLPAVDGFLLLREIYMIPKEQYKKRLAHLVTQLEVEGLLNTPIRRLSLGERMKMELIAALLHQPKVIFLDEPTIGLDITAQKAVRSFLKSYQVIHRPAIILTSHYMGDIEELCERVAILKDGHIAYDGAISGLTGSLDLSDAVENIMKSDRADAGEIHD
jgi:ABC-2 type transport system ATP-binding protein